jgi:hypothetical protein
MHCCMAQATYPKVWRAEPERMRLAAQLPPYLVLLRVGFAVPRALLPERCALTAPFHPYPAKAGRYVFCCTFRLTGLNPPSRTLSGTLLYGVRTFLSLLAKTATIRPDISILIIDGFSWGFDSRLCLLKNAIQSEELNIFLDSLQRNVNIF